MKELIERLNIFARLTKGKYPNGEKALAEAIDALEQSATEIKGLKDEIAELRGQVPIWVRVEDIKAAHYHFQVRCHIADNGDTWVLVAESIPALTAELVESQPTNNQSTLHAERCPNNCIDGVIVKFGGGEFDMQTSKCPIHHSIKQKHICACSNKNIFGSIQPPPVCSLFECEFGEQVCSNCLHVPECHA
jgi:hypothetical protein